MIHLSHLRAVGRSENLGVPVLFGGHNMPPLVEIGLTDLPKSGCAMAPRHPQGRQACTFKNPKSFNCLKNWMLGK